MQIYLKNIRVVNPTQALDGIYNILINEGKIDYFGFSEINVSPEVKIIEGDDLVCAPGFFDMHVHFRDPGQTYKEDIHSGILAAANGGFTGVVCMPNTNPPIDNPTIVEYIKSKSQNAIVDVFPAAAITKNLRGESLTSMFSLHQAGVVMFTDDGHSVMNSEVMRRAFDYSGTYDFLIAQHCEDVNLTENFAINEGVVSTKLGLKGYPAVAEEIILARDIMLAEYCGNRRYHAQHISIKGSVELIRKAKDKGLRVSCEVTPHHLTLDETSVEDLDSNFKMNPPLRTKSDIDALKKGLKEGIIDCIATDHAPHSSNEKDVEFEKAPNGVVGLETALGVVLTYLYHTGDLSLNKIVELMSINPRKILNLPLVVFKEGVEANMTIFSLNDEWIVDKQFFKSKSQNTPYDGYKLKGKPRFVINNNQFFVCNL
ncbi:dihydroorotase [Bacteroidetes/Chlorobi group bacterium MS-B_bin-24]|jgi:dihydroorotase|nr:MAG: dihydroorotase [Bacteroidetes/Chlorobi group bacterium MS-B_bin-24]